MTVPGKRTGFEPKTEQDTPSTGASQTATTKTVITSGYVNKWVRNLLGTPLTKAQISLLMHGPNFAVAPRHPPWGIHNHS